ncbi:MAG: hypothetical protein QM647_13080 [Asticcacaulis sp.]|uniref:hypothetical protein n=1 Tax=Asticcacaulis sp. TaxID=1872648 RepID=UPI0039E5E165
MADTAQTIPTHYMSSKGAMLITSMAYPHIVNAIAKLEREGRDDMAPVIAALSAQRDKLDAEREAAESAATVAEAVEGHNGAPELTPFEAVKAKLEDLRIEAGNWLDGAEVTSQEQANELGRLLDMVRKASSEADEARKAEKLPHDTAANEVQERFNTLIGNTKKVVGIAVRMETALKNAIGKWMVKVEREQQAERQRLAAIEAEQRRIAEEAISHTHISDDIDERDAAIAEMDKAREAAIELGVANRQRAQVETGGARAIGLRSVFRAEVTDRIEALKHYREDRLPEYQAALEAMVLQFANADIKAGKRSGIPGITIHEDRVPV